jgi:hypothetical protein
MDAVDVAREVVRDAVDSGRESFRASKKRHELEAAAREIAVVAAETLEDAAHRFKERQEAKGVKSNGRSKSNGQSSNGSKPRARKRTTRKKSSAKTGSKS